MPVLAQNQIATPEEKAALQQVIEVPVTLKLTREQWESVFIHYGVRSIACSCGLDDPRPHDFLLFQVVAAMQGQETVTAK